MNLETVYDTLFWGSLLDWCDSRLNYKASYFFYRLLSLFDMIKTNIEKGRIWNHPIIISDLLTEEEIEEMWQRAKLFIKKES